MENQAEELVLNEIESVDMGDSMPLLRPDLTIIGHVEVELVAEIGHVELTVEKMFSLKKGEVVAMKEAVNSDVVLCLNGKPVAKGSLVAINDNFGIQITELA